MKIGSKLSNRTKVIGGATILLGAATIICGIKDHLGLKTQDEADIVDVVEDVRDGIEEVIGEIPAEGEIIDF